MKIVIDLLHPAHVNFFKNIAERLVSEGNEVVFICLERGKLPLITSKEFPESRKEIIGRHTGTKYSVIFQANIKRFFRLFKFIYRNRFDIGLGVGAFNLGVVLKIFDIPNLQFDDDPERGLNTILEKLTATKLYLPPILESYGNVVTFNALKEWAYLSPKYFKPHKDVLSKYDLKEKEYIFIREISTGSLNYYRQKSNLLAKVSRDFPKNIKVIFSLENKKKLGYYPDNWIILSEPLEDIHSLIYYSKMLISSGDSMAREGGMLGVPSVYCGFRKMKANTILERKNILYHIRPEEINEYVEKILNHPITEIDQESFREELYHDWDDVNELIHKEINTYYKKKQ